VLQAVEHPAEFAGSSHGGPSIISHLISFSHIKNRFCPTYTHLFFHLRWRTDGWCYFLLGWLNNKQVKWCDLREDETVYKRGRRRRSIRKSDKETDSTYTCPCTMQRYQYQVQYSTCVLILILKPCSVMCTVPCLCPDIRTKRDLEISEIKDFYDWFLYIIIMFTTYCKYCNYFHELIVSA